MSAFDLNSTIDTRLYSTTRVQYEYVIKRTKKRLTHNRHNSSVMLG